MASPRMWVVGCVTILITLNILVYTSAAKVKKVWAIYDEKENVIKLESKPQTDYVAVATFENTINETGWAKLDVTTRAGPKRKYNDSLQAYAAGFVEGNITRSLMSMHWKNTVGWFCPEPYTQQCLELKKFLEVNMAFMKNNSAEYWDNPFWYHTMLYLEQVAGLQDSYAQATSGRINMNIDVFGVYRWQVAGDMEDLMQKFPNNNQKKGDDWGRMGAGHCSALLRLLPDLSDLYVAQDTWSDFSSMLRILKRYNFELHMAVDFDVPIPGNRMTFSSYPGTLMSGDDFYAIGSGLLTQETTIGNSNATLMKYITPASVLEGIRSMVSNRIAKSGFEWTMSFSQYNSGTYNNQWMVVDYKLFVAGRKTPIKGLFYLLEQIPGDIKSKEMSELLYNQTYYGSYNIAYFPEIFNKSGMPALVKKFGDWFTYEKTPRALIYKRDVPNVKDMDSMTKLMRYNNFKKDPLSRCNCTPPYSAENAIAARDDLNPKDGKYPFSALGHRPHAGTDMKLTNYKMFQSLSFSAISGPTYDDLPPFQWSTSDYKDHSHVGHPDLWRFPAIVFNGTQPFPGTHL